MSVVFESPDIACGIPLEICVSKLIGLFDFLIL